MQQVLPGEIALRLRTDWYLYRVIVLLYEQVLPGMGFRRGIALLTAARAGAESSYGRYRMRCLRDRCRGYSRPVGLGRISSGPGVSVADGTYAV